jgi:hypothetical protein
MKIIFKNKWVFLLLVLLVLLSGVLLSCQTKFFKKYSEPEKVVSNFYSWYLRDIYLKKRIESPILAINSLGLYQLDSKETFDYLRNTGYFSEQYFTNTQKKYDACNIELAKVDLKQIKESGAVDPSENINNCDFLHSMIWTGGMGEQMDSFEIIDSNIADFKTGSVASVLIRLKPYGSYASVNLSLENNKWLIDNIGINFYDAVKGWRKISD